MAVHDYIPGRPISLYDTKTWQKLSTIEAPAAGSGMERLVFSADGSRLTFASSDKFFVIDARTGQTVSTLPIKAAAFIALSPDNSMAAVEEVGTDPGDYVPKAIRIFRLSDGVQVASHASLSHGPNCAENIEDCGLASPILWDPTGRFLVFPDGYHTIRIGIRSAVKAKTRRSKLAISNMASHCRRMAASWRSVTATSSASSKLVLDRAIRCTASSSLVDP